MPNRNRRADLSSPQSSDSRGAEVHVTDVSHAFIHGKATVVQALSDVDIRIEPSTFVSIVGPSGCGKTTLLGMMAGVYSPSIGSVTVDGAEIDKSGSDVAYMLARDALMPWRSALSNVELGLEVRGVPKAERRRRAMENLEKVGLDKFADSPITMLSQGMRQRIAIARTLALSPRLILMDEPFAALDAQTRALQQAEFLKLWESERPTVVLVTHDLAEAIELSDRVLLMSSRPGRIIEDVQVDIPRPRIKAEVSKSPEFLAYHERLSTLLSAEVRAAMELV